MFVTSTKRGDYMTIDEAITHCIEVAEQNEDQSCKKCANEHRQLAEWLRELKAYREAEEAINRKMKSGQWSDAVVFGMGKALLIMRKHIREVNADEDSD